MKKIILLFVFLVVLFQDLLLGQSTVIKASFTGLAGLDYQHPDSILVKNLSRNCDTVLHYPDTLLILGFTSIEPARDQASPSLYLEVAPNPVRQRTTISVYTDRGGPVKITVLNLTGTTLEDITAELQPGRNQFSFTPGKDLVYLIVASRENIVRSVKVLAESGRRDEGPELAFIGTVNKDNTLKTAEQISSFSFVAGDRLLCAGYHDTLESGILIVPDGEELIEFQFAFDIPCPGAESIEYGGKTYTTVQILSQCWMKENLNLGTMVSDSTDQADNGLIEKYCYGNVEDSCEVYGGFYQWDEMMAYNSVPGSKGICPPGWHIPTDDDWKILEGAADSQLLIGDTSWNINGVRGTDCGFQLKSGLYWENDGNGSDIFGFTVPPIGYRDYWGYIYGFGHAAKFWSGDPAGPAEAWSRGFGCHGSDISRYNEDTANGYSVRCIKD